VPASTGTTAGNFLELYALAVRLARCDETGLKAGFALWHFFLRAT
jgi:hypothetical protein